MTEAEILSRLTELYHKRGARFEDVPDDIGLDFLSYEIVVDVERAFGVALRRGELSAELLRDADRFAALVYRHRATPYKVR